jgi:hypothetical protein
MLGGCYVV